MVTASRKTERYSMCKTFLKQHSNCKPFPGCRDYVYYHLDPYELYTSCIILVKLAILWHIPIYFHLSTIHIPQRGRAKPIKIKHRFWFLDRNENKWKSMFDEFSCCNNVVPFQAANTKNFVEIQDRKLLYSASGLNYHHYSVVSTKVRLPKLNY